MGNRDIQHHSHHEVHSKKELKQKRKKHHEKHEMPAYLRKELSKIAAMEELKNQKTKGTVEGSREDKSK